jgi:hypothetical protein
MSWITLTAADLNAYLVAEQLTALRTEALAVGQADPFTEVMPDVVNMIRAYIASNPANQVDASALTLPPELKLDVSYLIIGPLLGRLGIALTKDQSAALERAHSTLIALRDKKLVVSRPATPVEPDVQSATGVVLASSSTRQASRTSLSAL